MQPAPLTGTATSLSCLQKLLATQMQPAPLTGTATPAIWNWSRPCPRCSPHPSRGQQRRVHSPIRNCRQDAAHTPHGDNNFLFQPLPVLPTRCSPHPSRGQQQHDERIHHSLKGCSPHPSRGRKKGDKKQLCFLSPFLYKRLFPHLTLPYR